MSNIATITQMASNRLRSLASNLDSLIADYRIEAFYFLQPYTKKADDVVEIEDEYKPLERMLLADIIAINIIESQLLENSSSGAGATPSGAKRIKKAQADVVNVEFEYGDEFKMKADKILASSKASACSKAKALGYALPFCNITLDNTPTTPFMYFPKK